MDAPRNASTLLSPAEVRAPHDRDASATTAPDLCLGGHRLAAAWAIAGALLGALVIALVAASPLFVWERDLVDMPARSLAVGLALAGLVFLAVLPLVRATVREDAATQRGLLKLVLIAGVVMRVAMFASEPALEDDQQRYLWEGALAAHGISPFAVAPRDALRAPPGSTLARLAREGRPVLDKVNHPGLRTIYPPVAQAAFAIAHAIAPFSLTAWRLVVLGIDVATLAILLALLASVGRPAIWVALYWWNPIAIKELMNSAHMDGIAVMFALLGLLLAARKRPLSATAVLGLAAGAKLWPVLLVPLVWRPLLAKPGTLVAAAALLVALMAAWAAPIVIGGLDGGSGFVAYAAQWQTNSAHYPALRDLAASVLAALSLPAQAAAPLTRGLLAGLALAAALAAAWRPLRGTADLLDRASLVTLALVLASPVQFPWYMLWTMPFLPFAPRWGVMLLAVTVPMYYLSFHYRAVNDYGVFLHRVLWLVWLPVWFTILVELTREWRARPVLPAPAEPPVP